MKLSFLWFPLRAFQNKKENKNEQRTKTKHLGGLKESTMGTNFYWIVDSCWIVDSYWIVYLNILPTGDDVPIDRNDPSVHIGKRLAAGRYCWDCDRTFCKDGAIGIHTGQSEWHDECPGCGVSKVSDGARAAYVELGFAQPRDRRPVGVGSVSSFGWAQDSKRVRQICEQRIGDKLIEDEYGRKYTGGAFLQMLKANCPIEFTHSVGRWFC